MKKLPILVALVMVFSIMLSPCPSYSKSITTPDGDVYKPACGRIKIGIDIYYWASAAKKMIYIGRVIDMGKRHGERVVWLRMARSKRVEMKSRKAICHGGWVKVKEGKD